MTLKHIILMLISIFSADGTAKNNRQNHTKDLEVIQTKEGVIKGTTKILEESEFSVTYTSSKVQNKKKTRFLVCVWQGFDSPYSTQTYSYPLHYRMLLITRDHLKTLQSIQTSTIAIPIPIPAIMLM